MTMGSQELIGSLWRVKKRANSLVILPKPMMFCDFLNQPEGYDRYVPGNCFLDVGDVIIVSSSRLFSAEHFDFPQRDDKFQTWLKVALPFEGYINSTFFHKDSMWIERIG